MLGQLDPAEELCRVLDVRGPGSYVRRGMTLPLAAVTEEGDDSSTGNGAFATPIDGQIDQDSLRSLSVKASLSRPLEMSDGSIIGTLSAFDTETDAFGDLHQVLLGVAARVLSYEWENVNRLAELRRLREQVRDVHTSDVDTGLSNRARFLDALEREWRLTARGSVQSILVVCHLHVDAAQSEVVGTISTLALKDAAEVLVGTIRSTDHVGRTGTMDLAVVLVGCHGLTGAQAFLRRFREGVRRVTSGRAAPISVSCSVLPLVDSPSAQLALEHAERTARERSAGDTVAPPLPAQQPEDA
jgi:GGDEF domain-containing protein